MDAATLSAIASSPMLKTPGAIVNYFSSGSPTPATNIIGQWGQQKLTGATTANQLSTVLSLSGSGVLRFVGIASANNAAKTLRCRITLDGNVAFDNAVVLASAVQNSGLIAIGAVGFISGGWALMLDDIPFRSSALIEASSSVTETGGIIAVLNYRA